MATKTKKRSPRVQREITLWNVLLSYPDLVDPAPFKGNISYRTDVIIKKNHPSLKELKIAVKDVFTEAFGEDESEWPEPKKHPLIRNGDEHEQEIYHGSRYIAPKSKDPIPVVDAEGKAVKANLAKGGMYANVAVTVAKWELDGEENVSIYLNGIQLLDKEGVKVGSGRSVKQMFANGNDDEDADENFDDEDEAPAPKKKKRVVDEDDEDEAPAPKKKKRVVDEDDEDEAPAPKKKKRVVDEDEDDEDDMPRKKNKPSRNFDEDDEE